MPPGTIVPVEGTLLAHLEKGHTVVRDDMAGGSQYREEPAFVAAGLRSRVAVPLIVGERTIGALSVSRAEPDAFAQEDVDLIALLARQVTSAIENTRAYEAERNAAEELRRLSALRADFVSLVSHELRGPMASIVGCAATLRQRWRSLDSEQRERFLALIEEETSRLAGLVGDVLDTSRIEAGTFALTLGDVDVDELVRETAAIAAMGQSDVELRTEVAGPLPTIRADRNRLRQVLVNLLTNALKYTVAGDEVELRAAARNGQVEVIVQDHGPGIPPEDQRLIFEKFGRASPSGSAKPGAGLGLFIARSIVEAHGGTLDVQSQRGEGAAFVVRLPTAPGGPPARDV
jgi:signal transduction histidine kinase